MSIGSVSEFRLCMSVALRETGGVSVRLVGCLMLHPVHAQMLIRVFVNLR